MIKSLLKILFQIEDYVLINFKYYYFTLLKKLDKTLAPVIKI